MRLLRPVWIIGVLFLLFGAIPTVVGFITDWLWFREIGYQAVFTTEIFTKTLLFLAGTLIAYLFITLNARYAAGGISKAPVLWRVSPELPPVDIGRSLSKIVLPVGGVVALLFGATAAGHWMDVLQLLNRSSFGLSDPVFGREIGYYVFVLPVIASAIGMLRGLVIFALLASLFLHLLRGRVVLPPQRVGLEPPADRHVAALLVAFLLLTAVQIWLVRIPELMYSTTGPLVGASYTDLHARLPALHITSIAALIGAGLVIYGMLRRKIVWFTVVSFLAYVAVSIVVGGLFPWAMQRFVVAPTELTREAPQLRNHIRATRAAWALDKVETRTLGGDALLTLADIRANAATVENVRLWDRDPLLQTFGQLQEIRTYYDFKSIDDDRYIINGRYRQVLLSPRELNSGSLPTRTFINQHLTFTHGMGLTLGPVNEVTSEGLPVLYVKDLPPSSSVSIKVTRPQLYFGELTTDHVFVNTRQAEFDYPSGEANIQTRYSGTAGVRVGSFLTRAMFAMRFGALNILLSGDIRSDSRVLYNREVANRVHMALPFLTFDDDPYLVIAANGELKWILDGYTSTSRYPYSQRLTDGTSYMRNSVKVVVDAYNGSVDAYIVDAADPLARTYGKIFPGLLKPGASMPADMRAHMRYPTDLFRVQTQLYATYHMDAAESFYHREDQWQIPAIGDQSESGNRFMRHIVMKLPEESRAEFIYMAPFTPKGKDNLASWMIARNDGVNYGRLRVYTFPKQSLVYGPRQIMSRINQDTDISRELTLWDQRGSEVIRGELLVIPIEEALIYVQPVYLRAEGGRIPELKRVVVAYQNRVVMRETLEAGLATMFGGEVPRAVDDSAAVLPRDSAGGPLAPAASAAPATVAPTTAALATEARSHYDKAIAAQRAGDWATYGREIQALGDVLRRLNAGNR
ncbi:MAG TPA: UPF0182 family protein [Gemmatimonadaceae bacterium]|nr:UPF0182 family protein [Gemmatimonadaceae bacterium]